jgi:ComF family protein
MKTVLQHQPSRPHFKRFITHLKLGFDTIFPGHCVLCGLFCRGQRLCRDCHSELPRITSPCHSCALPGVLSEARLCGRCLKLPPMWSDAMAALIYQYPINHLVRDFKFKRSLAAGQLLADEMTTILPRFQASRPDLILPVPLHFTRRLKRGFNQAEFLARQVAKKGEIPFETRILRRIKRTGAQSGLSRKERKTNIKGAFDCKSLQGLKIVLVDDVLTTGTTLTECCKAVKAAGAVSVSVWVAARVPPSS